MTEQKEVWKKIKGMDYWVSNLGRIKNPSGEILGGRKDALGFRQVNIRGEVLCVSRLVASEFIPNPEQFKYVKFKNGDQRDCRVDNLYWYPSKRRSTILDCGVAKIEGEQSKKSVTIGFVANYLGLEFTSDVKIVGELFADAKLPLWQRDKTFTTQIQSSILTYLSRIERKYGYKREDFRKLVDEYKAEKARA